MAERKCFFGLDSGNVWEWCYDRYGSVSTGDVTDPVGATSDSLRVQRGGSWNENASCASVCCRNSKSPGIWGRVLGFRVCRNAN